MQTISEYNPIGTIIQGLRPSVAGSIVFGTTVFPGFGIGTFFGLLLEEKIADFGGALNRQPTELRNPRAGSPGLK